MFARFIPIDLLLLSDLQSRLFVCRGTMPRKPYPTPLIVPPSSNKHTHTIISLHGRGSNAERYGHELLQSANLSARLPTVKFVFPTASKRRSTVLKKIPINQWFDNYSLDDPGERTELQVEGLCETAEFVRGLIDQEAEILGEGGYQKIALWGLSQGCAAGIFTLLGGWSDTNGGKNVGAFVGLSGWLPFEQNLSDILRCDRNTTVDEDGQDEQDSDNESEGESTSSDDDDEEEDDDDDEDEDPIKLSDAESEDDPFERPSASQDEFDPFAGDEENAKVPLPKQAIDYIRDILDLPPISASEQSEEESLVPTLYQLRIPVFIGHGAEDPKVSVTLGEKMSRTLLTGLGMNVTWNSYQGLGHWYRVEDEVEDILKFLESHVKLPLEKRS